MSGIKETAADFAHFYFKNLNICLLHSYVYEGLAPSFILAFKASSHISENLSMLTCVDLLFIAKKDSCLFYVLLYVPFNS